MSLDALDRSLERELAALRAEGRAKPPERVWPAASRSSSA